MKFNLVIASFLFITQLSVQTSYASSPTPPPVHAYSRMECTLTLNGKNVPRVASEYRGPKGRKVNRYKQNEILFQIEQIIENDSMKFKFNLYQVLTSLPNLTLGFIGSSEQTLSLDAETAKRGMSGTLEVEPEPVELTSRIGSLNGVLVEATCKFPDVY